MERSAHLMAKCSRTITDALVSPRNIVYPKLKVKFPNLYRNITLWFQPKSLNLRFSFPKIEGFYRSYRVVILCYYGIRTFNLLKVFLWFAVAPGAQYEKVLTTMLFFLMEYTLNPDLRN